MPAERRADLIRPVEPGHKAQGFDAGGTGEEGFGAVDVLVAAPIGCEPRRKHARAASICMDDESGFCERTVRGAASEFLDQTSEVLPIPHCIEADSVVVDGAVCTLDEEGADLRIVGGLALQNIEVPDQALGINDLWYAEYGAIAGLVVAPRRG